MTEENEDIIEIKNGIRLQICKWSHTALVTESKLSGDVFIPQYAEYEGEKYKITLIKRHAFASTKINALTFPENSEITIFDNPFDHTEIKKLQIPPKLYEIDFSGLEMLEEIEISPKNKLFKYINNKYLLRKKNEESDVFDILYWARLDIEEAIIPPQIKILGKNSFREHERLKSIIFPKNSQLQEIQNNALAFTPIIKLVLPSTLKKIEDTFCSIEKLVDIELPPENPYFSYVENKFLLQKNDTTNKFDILIFCRRDVECITIPSYIKCIRDYSISDCTKLQSITFEPNSSVDTLCKYAFSSDILLKSIIIPPSVRFVEDDVFHLDKNLEYVEFLGDNLRICMNSFDRYHPFLSEERREALVSFPNATNLEFKYGFLCYDFQETTIIKVRHDAKLTGSALPVIQDRIKYFGDEEEKEEKNTKNQRKEDIDTNKEKMKDQKEKKKTNIYMKHIRYLEKILRKYEKVIPFEPIKSEIDEKDQEESGKDKKEIESLKQELDSLREKIKKLEQKSNQATNLEIFEANSVDLLKVIKTIGRGPQSEVYEVSREQNFALKVFYFESAKTSSKKRLKSKNKKEVFDQLNDLLHDYEILNALNHRNIIRTYGFCFGDEKHSPSILLQYCSNNLNDIVEEMNDIQRVCAIFEISSGMEAVHAANCIHKNLKPDNILIDDEGHIRISDFGSYISDVDNKSTRIGSIKFLAPEILNGKTDCNNKIDVYSFGVVVFFILTCGQLPKISIGDQSSGKKAPIPNRINKISRSLINRCWSTNPEDRPSFKEIVEYITSKKFKLIDGIEKNMKEIKEFLSI